jgi:hypothetical protein
VSNTYKICVAGINIEIKGVSYPLFERRFKEYFADFETADVSVSFEIKNEISRPEGKFSGKTGYRVWQTGEKTISNYDIFGDKIVASIEADENFSNVHGTLCDIEKLGGAECEVRFFNMMGEIFRYAALCRGGCVIHASAVRLDGKAVAFSAPSGVGKSTHAALWEKYFSADIINDDSPLVSFEGEKAFLYGTPWSGKSDKNMAVKAPLSAVFFLCRAKKPAVLTLSDCEKAFRIIKELPVPPVGSFADKYAAFSERLIKAAPMYILNCDISKESAEAAKDLLKDM